MMRTLFKLICILTVSLFFYSQSWAQDGLSDTPNIQVLGHGEVIVSNSEAKISAAVTTLRDTADEALRANNMAVQEVFNALNGVGLGPDNLQTSSFSVHPRYEYENNIRVFRGYQVSNSVQITVDEIESLGPLLDLIINSGATEINSVSFGVADVELIKQQAITLATTDAENKAELLAQLSGVTLGKAIQITLHTGGSITPGNNFDSAFSPPAPIAAGQNAVTARVQVTYEILNES